MRTIEDGYRGITLIMTLNWDRAMGLGVVGLALWIAAGLGNSLH